eukprot:TRINITY_DN50210_c0_g1_i1.p1 TRINITY_DN50210_c0_g1~~TRINITY_DN50210_c0_g1_i1.p1  ORF type:complete len:215 (+),score=31.16 TRINITY_DN50210_c0_g1_i1:241-885(+)
MAKRHVEPALPIFSTAVCALDNASSQIWRHTIEGEFRTASQWQNKYGSIMNKMRKATTRRVQELAPGVTLKNDPYNTMESCKQVREEFERSFHEYKRNKERTLKGHKIFGYGAAPQPIPFHVPPAGVGHFPERDRRRRQEKRERRHRLESTRHKLEATISQIDSELALSLIHISEPTRLLSISYAVFCLKKKKTKNTKSINSVRQDSLLLLLKH